MFPENDRTFRPVIDRADMRVILAAELGRFGAEMRLIASTDEMVSVGIADVLVSDDDDELIMLQLSSESEPNEVKCFVVTADGLLRIGSKTVH